MLFFPSSVFSDKQKIDFFNHKVLPILETNCFNCHSHDSGKMKGGLTLDSKLGWSMGGDHGPSIIPGNLKKSILIEAVEYKDEDFSMPPKKKLPETDIAILKQWVQEGAFDPRESKEPIESKNHNPSWAWKPLRKIQIPKSTYKHPIDAFISKKHLEKGLSMSKKADHRTLLRRMTVNLHGLLPSIKELQTFEMNQSPHVVNKKIKQLLNSPRYGERWAQHWLDTAHFADSHGCEHDTKRPNAWRYRDYVIKSFNQDIPWSRFIREQIAVDAFFPEESNLIPALGFLSAGPLEASRAGTAPITFDYLDRDDMLTQVMASFNSMTINCARCHKHKFDPISQDDYYALQAVFSGIGKGEIEYDHDNTIAKQRRYWKHTQDLIKQNSDGMLKNKYIHHINQFKDQWKNKKPVLWHDLNIESFTSMNGSNLKRLKDQSILVSGPIPDKEVYSMTASTSLNKISAFKIHALSHESLPKKGPGRAGNGNFHLSEVELLHFHPSFNQAQRIKIKQVYSNWDQSSFIAKNAFDGKHNNSWAIYPKVGQNHTITVTLDKVISINANSRLVIKLHHKHLNKNLIGRFKIEATNANPKNILTVPDSIKDHIHKAWSKTPKSVQKQIASYVLSHVAEKMLKSLPKKSKVYAATKRYSHNKKLPSPMKEPKVVHVLKRGNIHKPGKVAQPGAITHFAHLKKHFKLKSPQLEATRRTALANWLADKRNPLTWRSIVNRVWHYHFGVGLSKTLNDLGNMGEKPSHPELLDWLAIWFRDEAKGSLKKLHLLIMSSHTYQQTSLSTKKTNDTENRFLWKMNRTRLDAENYRDIVLQLSKRLNLKMGGPGIEQFIKSKGPQSTPNLNYEAYQWDSPNSNRRSIYRVVWRGIPDPFMEAMDYPDQGLLNAKRTPSYSALQALTLYNNNFVMHHAKAYANFIESRISNKENQIRSIVEQIWQRLPTHQELQEFIKYKNTHGLAALIRILLNSNEFLFID